MAFKIDLSETYNYPVSLEIVGDKGKYQKFSFNAEFKRLSQSEVEQLGEDIRPQGGEPAKLNDEDLVDIVMVNWSDIYDEHGQPIEFSNPKHKAAVLDVFGVKQALVKGFFESINGVKRKN